MDDKRMIRVTGQGMIRIHPDVTCLTLKLNEIFPEYNEALLHSAEDTKQLQATLKPFGFESSDLKTTKFRIDASYESYKEHDAYKQRLVGYKYTHELKLEFDSDNERLGKILYALGHSAVRPEVRIGYTIKDKEGAKNAVIGKAVQDAKVKAENLTQAADVKLGEILRIDYSWSEVKLEADPMDGDWFCDLAVTLAQKESSYDVGIEPDDIEVKDSVTVIWAIL